MTGYESDCCGGAVRAEGRTTQHYACASCGNPCDAVRSGAPGQDGGPSGRHDDFDPDRKPTLLDKVEAAHWARTAAHGLLGYAAAVASRSLNLTGDLADGIQRGRRPAEEA
jgi:hypothetical protein